jgi:hypothetical protein
LAVDFEGCDHYRADWLPVVFLAFFAVAGDLLDFGVFENGDVEVCSFFGLIVEPEARGDGLHF